MFLHVCTSAVGTEWFEVAMKFWKNCLCGDRQKGKEMVELNVWSFYEGNTREEGSGRQCQSKITFKTKLIVHFGEERV